MQDVVELGDGITALDADGHAEGSALSRLGMKLERSTVMVSSIGRSFGRIT